MSYRSALLSAALALATAFGLSSGAQAQLTNGGFELPHFAGVSSSQISDTTVPGWKTTASDHLIEIWSNGFLGVTPYEGTQFAELNATQVATLYQDKTGIAAGSVVGFQFAHRGRVGPDTMQVSITDAGIDNLFGTGDDTILFSKQYTDDTTAWGFYTNAGEPTITTLGHDIRFAYDSISSTGGVGVGNFLDAADFGVGIGQSADTPEPGSLGLMIGLGVTGVGILRSRRKK